MGGKKIKTRLPFTRNRKGIEKNLKHLKRLIPGGNKMDNAETLYQTTANYIYLLERQVSLLRNISALCTGDNSQDSTVESTSDSE